MPAPRCCLPRSAPAASGAVYRTRPSAFARPHLIRGAQTERRCRRVRTRKDRGWIRWGGSVWLQKNCCCELFLRRAMFTGTSRCPLYIVHDILIFYGDVQTNSWKILLRRSWLPIRRPYFTPQVLVTHSKAISCPSCCILRGKDGNSYIPCCCCLPYLITKDAEV